MDVKHTRTQNTAKMVDRYFILVILFSTAAFLVYLGMFYQSNKCRFRVPVLVLPMSLIKSRELVSHHVGLTSFPTRGLPKDVGQGIGEIKTVGRDQGVCGVLA